MSVSMSGSTSVKLTQERFLLHGDSSRAAVTWSIPLRYGLLSEGGEEEEKLSLLSTKSTTLPRTVILFVVARSCDP